MTSFEVSKECLGYLLLLMFNKMKSAAQSHRLLVKTYEKHSPSVKTSEYWFRLFKSGDFDPNGKDCHLQPRFEVY